MTTLEILSTGPLAVVQDLGRAGLAQLGVSPSGAADRRSHKLANRLVANPDDRATIEVTFGGFPAERQLPSEGATCGAIQVPPNGLPVILGPDHSVTSGYPVVGVVVDEDIDKVAQVRPGQRVRLHWARPRSPLRARLASSSAGWPFS